MSSFQLQCDEGLFRRTEKIVLWHSWLLPPQWYVTLRASLVHLGTVSARFEYVMLDDFSEEPPEQWKVTPGRWFELEQGVSYRSQQAAQIRVVFRAGDSSARVIAGLDTADTSPLGEGDREPDSGVDPQPTDQCADADVAGLASFTLRYGFSLVEEPGSGVMEPFTFGIRDDEKPVLNTFLGVDYKQDLNHALAHVRQGDYTLWAICWDGYITLPDAGRTDAIYVRASRPGSGVEMLFAQPYRRTAPEAEAEAVGEAMFLATRPLD
jgi:hypothetical protein